MMKLKRHGAFAPHEQTPTIQEAAPQGPALFTLPLEGREGTVVGPSWLQGPETGLSHGQNREVREFTVPEPEGQVRDVPVLALTP